MGCGLSVEDHNRLAHEVDVIYHIGAWVHHVMDYATLYRTNVQSTVALLRLATRVKNKALHYISTLGAHHISPLERLQVVSADSEEVSWNSNGYLLTKWVSEQLLEVAVQRGIVAHVYRPGNIIAGASGIYEPEANHALLRLKGMIQLGKAYVEPHEMLEMMPVDRLASALVHLARNPQQFSYNLHNAQSIAWVDYLTMVQAMGYPLQFLQNEAEWDVLLDHLDEQNALYKLVFLYKRNRTVRQARVQLPVLVPDYVMTVPTYVELIRQQVLSLQAAGFLRAPSLIRPYGAPSPTSGRRE